MAKRCCKAALVPALLLMASFSSAQEVPAFQQGPTTQELSMNANSSANSSTAAVNGMEQQASPGPSVEAASSSPSLGSVIENCQSEWQVVLCGDIPWDNINDLAACCALHQPAQPSSQAAGAVITAAKVRSSISNQIPRSDLDTAGQLYNSTPEYYFGKCMVPVQVQLPTFSRDSNSNTQVSYATFNVPTLSAAAISRIKSKAVSAAPRALRQKYTHTRAVNPTSGFLHPGGFAGPEQLAAMESRLAANVQPQVTARDSLLTGQDVPPKLYGSWYAQTDAPPEGYIGPLAMQKFELDYGGIVLDNTTCPSNYPAGAPVPLCGHISLVEMDGMMAYKQAMAYFATRDVRYARQALAILLGWARTNTVFGLKYRNGPLEAAWACGSMARAMELLRSARWPEFQQSHLSTFRSWVQNVLMPQMDYYVNTVTPAELGSGRKNVYGNWHASIADCMMAAGVLADDRARYNTGRNLYITTLTDYLKWGRGDYVNSPGYSTPRVIGEATETLRDIYHSEFALGSLMQAAETAWNQNEDLYRVNNYALAAAMEFHARIINAKLSNDVSMLPPGYKFFESMPKAPSGCAWKWDIETQLWVSYKGSTVCSNLTDGFKYAVGITHLPTGWEIGYNHFVGRLGVKLPETAALLARSWPDYYTFSWGLGTLSHADTAKQLWRPGLKKAVVCKKG